MASSVTRILGQLNQAALTELEIAKEFNKQVQRLDQAIEILRADPASNAQAVEELLQIESSLVETMHKLLANSSKAAKTAAKEALRANPPAKG